MKFRVNYSIIFVSDMQRSIGFYRDVVGIPLKFETPEWTEFATEGATLALHKAEAGTAQSASGALEKAGQCRAGFAVSDLEGFHERMTQHEVRCVQPPRETFGVKIAQYADPDGMVFSVSGAHGN